MSHEIPSAFEHLLKPPTIVSLATLLRDGQPQVTATWIDYDGEYLYINTAEGRQKDRNMKRNPKVTILAIDPKNTERYIEVRGTIIERTYNGAVDHINKQAQAYRGFPEYFGHVVPEALRQTMVRVMYKIQPTRVTTRG